MKCHWIGFHQRYELAEFKELASRPDRLYQSSHIAIYSIPRLYIYTDRLLYNTAAGWIQLLCLARLQADQWLRGDGLFSQIDNPKTNGQRLAGAFNYLPAKPRGCELIH